MIIFSKKRLSSDFTLNRLFVKIYNKVFQAYIFGIYEFIKETPYY